MKILLTGRSGQLGARLATQLRQDADVIVPSHAEFDLERPQQLRDFIRHHQPHLIVNAAAYTAVDQAESDPSLAMRINAEAPGMIAAEAQRVGAALIHYSTDYVFDGAQARPYNENDCPRPLNMYGRSKLLGEQQVASACQAHWIVRCSWIYSSQGRNFLRTFWRLAQERQQLQVVDDQIGAPTWANTIVAATVHMVAQAARSADGLHDYIRARAGIYHLTARGQTSWHGMAMHILQRMAQAGIALQLTQDQLQPIASANYPTPAQRPLNSRLQTAKLQQVFQWTLPEWHDDLDACIDELLQTPATPPD